MCKKQGKIDVHEGRYRLSICCFRLVGRRFLRLIVDHAKSALQ